MNPTNAVRTKLYSIEWRVHLNLKKLGWSGWPTRYNPEKEIVNVLLGRLGWDQHGVSG